MTIYRSARQGRDVQIRDLRRRVAEHEAEIHGVGELLPPGQLQRVERTRTAVEELEAGEPPALISALERHLAALEEVQRALPALRRARARVPQMVPPPHTLHGGPRPPYEVLTADALEPGTMLQALVAEAVRLIPGARRVRPEVFVVCESEQRWYFMRESLDWYPPPHVFACARFEYLETPLALAWHHGAQITVATSVARAVPELLLSPRRFLSPLLRVLSRWGRPVRMGHRELDRTFDLVAPGKGAAAVPMQPHVRSALLALARHRVPTLRIRDSVAELWWRCGGEPERWDVEYAARVLHEIRGLPAR